ncbi:hypothetical protein QQG91_08490 [Marivivens sp. LCG002]|uniref:hypothetical protein n=1 Tax=Marivivens sp. LCG002 TaxID=3051171 RepID=UPI002554D7E1|nr:hypothetical protein [Marivivens sp. LCG002]WIV49715.1 hypothetical protein QQG91_08490 [Marivivens sp. LCG002]
MKKFLTVAAIAAALTAGSASVVSAQAAGNSFEALLQQCAANPEACASNPAIVQRLVAAARQQGGNAAATQALIERAVATVTAANAAVVRSACETNPASCAARTRQALQAVRTVAQSAGVSPTVVNNAVGTVVATVVAVGNTGNKSAAVLRQISQAVQLAADPQVGFVPSSNAAEQATINARVQQALAVQQSFNNGNTVSQQVLAQLGSAN